MKKIKIAFYTIVDPLDKRSWSGIPYYLGKALEQHGYDVDFLGPVKMPPSLNKFYRAVTKLNRILFKSEYYVKHSLLWGWYAGHVLRKRMKGHTYDCICAPGAATELAFLKKDNTPVICAIDATFNLLINYYIDEYGKICRLSKWEGNYLEKKAFKKSDFIISASHWAANSAINYYHYNKNNIIVLPLCANVDSAPPKNIILNKLQNKTLTLLYLAVDWKRKGGEIAFNTFLQLNNVHGIKTKLIVCGCRAPDGFNHPLMEVIPFLNKNIEADYERFVNLFTTTHFLILPTRADCSLIVASEANAYGIPAITTETGGVPEVVKDGVNGYCLPYSANADTYASLISELFIDESKYRELILSSRERFEKNLNWNVWAETFHLLIQKNTKAQLVEITTQLNTV